MVGGQKLKGICVVARGPICTSKAHRQKKAATANVNVFLEREQIQTNELLVTSATLVVTRSY